MIIFQNRIENTEDVDKLIAENKIIRDIIINNAGYDFQELFQKREIIKKRIEYLLNKQ